MANDCEIEMFDTTKRVTFDIWSNVSKRWILRDANETMLKNFYESLNNYK
jgi:hypothetical protein